MTFKKINGACRSRIIIFSFY